MNQIKYLNFQTENKKMHDVHQLTIEQEFKLTTYRQKLLKLNNRNIKRYLIQILKKIMIKDNIIKHYIRNYI